MSSLPTPGYSSSGRHMWLSSDSLVPKVRLASSAGPS